MTHRGLLKPLLVAIVVFTFTLPASAQPLSQTELVDLFSEGKRQFREALDVEASDPTTARRLYTDSLARFRRIAEEGGIRNGKLLYNIGNIHFRLGNVGQAILFYRRALRYAPNNSDLLHNLEYARSTRVDHIEEQETRTILKTLFFWHFDFSPQFRLVVFCITCAVAWVSAALFVLLRRRSLVWIAVMSALVTTAFLGSLAADEISSSRNAYGVILADEVVARKGDNESYQPSFRDPLHEGTEFKLLERRKEWFYIELADGRRSWIPSDEAGLLW